MSNRIEKQVDLKAPVSRVWRALTDSREFGAWFGVNMQSPFVPGKVASGQLLYPGLEHITLEVVVQKMEEGRLFSFTWHPYAIQEGVDFSEETPTLVEFTLEPTQAGTLLKVVESGFENLPEHRRELALRMDDEGWSAQLRDIEKYVAGNP